MDKLVTIIIVIYIVGSILKGCVTNVKDAVYPDKFEEPAQTEWVEDLADVMEPDITNYAAANLENYATEYGITAEDFQTAMVDVFNSFEFEWKTTSKRNVQNLVVTYNGKKVATVEYTMKSDKTYEIESDVKADVLETALDDFLLNGR